MGLAALLASSCTKPEGAAVGPIADSTNDRAIEKSFERGPLKVILRVEPKEPTFAERVRFTLRAVAKKGVEVTLPSPGERLGAFLIKDYDVPPTIATADTVERGQSYVLEFLTSGDYTIPALTIAFRDGRGDAAPVDPTAPAPPVTLTPESDPAVDPAPPAPSEPAPEYKLITEPLVVKVQQLNDPESLQALSPIEAQAEPPALPPELFWPIAIAASLAVAAALFVLVRRLQRRPDPLPPSIPPHERAYRELEWLLAQLFIDRGELKEFFFHLSRILREYIERQHGLRAPELTTEEFLEEMSTRSPGGVSPGAAPAILPEHRSLLREFLERADLVKFARYTPGRDEIESSFEAAKRFIEVSRRAAASEIPETAAR